MNILQIVQLANTLADESIETNKVLGFVNDAVARINVKCGANFPFFSSNTLNDDYAGFSETWQRALLVPFAVGRIKQTDSSQFEYSDSYGEFTDNLIEFKARYTIPAEYKDAGVKTSFAPSFDGNYFAWDNGKGSNGDPLNTSSSDSTDTEIIVSLDGGVV